MCEYANESRGLAAPRSVLLLRVSFHFVPFHSVLFLPTAVYGRDRVENSTRDLLAYYTNCDLLAAGAVDSGTVGTIHQAM